MPTAAPSLRAMRKSSSRRARTDSPPGGPDLLRRRVLAGAQLLDRRLHLALARVRRQQAEGYLTSKFDERHLVLAKLSLTMFPAAFPHITRLIMDKSVRNPKFQRDYANFLKRFAVAFRPAPRRVKRAVK